MLDVGNTHTIDNELIERFLDYLIDPYHCIDTYGRSYLDDLELIVEENHRFDFKSQIFPDEATQGWFKRICAASNFQTIEEIVSYVRANRQELDIANLRPRSAFQGEALFENETSFQELRRDEKSVEKSNEFQRIWSMQSFTDMPRDDADAYEYYMSYDRVNPWTYLLRRELRRKNLHSEDSVICIGNRWIGEVLYFRENLGLKKAMGVDLFSTDPDLVVAADMHHMPFADNSIKMVFNRGLINKSYDVRLLVREILRVLAPDGFLIVETPGPYEWGVSRLGRTDVKSVQNLLRLFRGKVRRVIYAEETKPKRYVHDATRLLRLFIQVDKNGCAEEPSWEKFPKQRFQMYDAVRGEWLLWRLRTRRWLKLASKSRAP
jgi:SAM-dependent methyltransferase